MPPHPIYGDNMNANELADKAEAMKTGEYGYADGWIDEAATMLRILDGQLAFRIDAVTKYQKKVEEQQAEIEALKQVLGRYVNEVPLGNQPHMLAHIALDLVNNG